MHNKSVALIIIDGLGLPATPEGIGNLHANMPTISRWLDDMPSTRLASSGNAVGLPDGYMGNSEVGHYTIGAGRIVEQPTTIIEKGIEDKSLYANQTLVDTLQLCKNNSKQFHIVGILSDAGIHGNQSHIVAYAQAAYEQGVHNIYVHAILDGRDTPTHSAEERIANLKQSLQPFNAIIATITGRFFAMDRNKNYERTHQAYHILTNHDAPITVHWQSTLYQDHNSEEFCQPMRIAHTGYIEDGDTVLFTACRADRIRQLVLALSGNKTVLGNQAPVENLTLVSPVSYGTTIPTKPLYVMPSIHNTLKEVLCTHHRSVFSIAETEKYAHVTYFFNGEREQVLTCEVRHLVPSLNTKNYVDTPAMKAQEITDAVMRSVSRDPKDFYLINYANADMVGHSGNADATIKALRAVDKELKRLYATIVEEMDGTLFITGDHGNAEAKLDHPENSSPMHTTNTVPFIVVTKKPLDLSLVASMHGLADIAPLILTYMGISVPPEMTGHTAVLKQAD